VFEKTLRFLSGKLSYKRQVVLVSITGRYSSQNAQSELLKVLEKVITVN